MGEELLVHESRIHVPYLWSAGGTGSRFLKALRDDKKFLATRCPSCRGVFCPPKSVCPACFEDCSEWLEVGPHGVLVSYTQVLYSDAERPRHRPLFGLIKLEGADTCLLHRLGECALNKLSIGARVAPVFAESRTGSILDVSYFTLAF